MRRWFAAIAVLALGATGLVGPGIAAGDQSRAQLRSSVCHNALDPQNRTASVKAVMRPMAGTQKLQLKFDLLVSHSGSQSQSTVHARNLGNWLVPKNPTLGRISGDVWNFKKTVVQLDAPATYQFRVSFRWIGSGGRVIGSAVRYTKRCAQPELRPDLLVDPITVTPDGSQDTYTTVIRNAGASPAGPFLVALFAPDSSAQPEPMTIQLLKPGREQTVTFLGPPCNSDAPPTITADSALEVDDLDRSNNTATAVCPSTGNSALSGN